MGAIPFMVAISPTGAFAYVTHLGADIGYEADDDMISSYSPYLTKIVRTIVNNIVYYTATSINLNFEVEPNLYSVAISKDGTVAYVANSNTNSIAVIDTASDTLTTSINQVYVDSLRLWGVERHATEGNPLVPIFGVAISPDGTNLFVSTGYGNGLIIIDIPLNVVSETMYASGSYVPATPTGDVVFDPTGNYAYVCSPTSVQVFDIAADTTSSPLPLSSSEVPYGLAVCPLPPTTATTTTTTTTTTTMTTTTAAPIYITCFYFYCNSIQWFYSTHDFCSVFCDGCSNAGGNPYDCCTQFSWCTANMIQI